MLVIGGGITGVGIALDAAIAGLRVALVEKHDLAFGTSRWSSKLVHGGLRYLATGNVGIARRRRDRTRNSDDAQRPSSGSGDAATRSAVAVDGPDASGRWCAPDFSPATCCADGGTPTSFCPARNVFQRGGALDMAPAVAATDSTAAYSPTTGN